MLLCFSGCRKPDGLDSPQQVQSKEAEGDSFPNPSDQKILSLPLHRTITGKDGRQLAVTIVSRSATHITITRDSDRKSFDLAIEKLSEPDQALANAFPISEKSAQPVELDRLERRRKQIRKLEEKVSNHKIELNSGTLTSSQSSAVRGKIKRLKQEIINDEGRLSVPDPQPNDKKGSSARRF